VDIINNKYNLGKSGEDIAASFLIKSGYHIIDRNVHIKKYGEIDIICENNKDIVFVEVKRRSDYSFGLPQDAVNHKKQKQLIKLALLYIKMKNIKNKNIRFDVVALSPSGCELIKNAFIADKFYTY
jgi:putative endonuclease